MDAWMVLLIWVTAMVMMTDDAVRVLAASSNDTVKSCAMAGCALQISAQGAHDVDFVAEANAHKAVSMT